MSIPKITKKALLAIIRSGGALDVSAADEKHLDLVRAKGLNLVSYSVGKYGINGALFYSNSLGGLCAISSRCSSLFYLL